MKKLTLTGLFGLLGLSTMFFSPGCGGGGAKSVVNSSGGGGTTPANSIVLTAGPGTFSNGYVNALYATITICQPGTSNCTTLDHVLVDSGSSGLRIVDTELPSGFSLTTEKVGSNSVFECLPFLDSYTWGNVVTADVELAGEKATSLPVQMITAKAAPTTCTGTVATSGSPAVTSEADLGARAILGIGNFIADCGAYCTSNNQYDLYFGCSSTSASSCTQIGVPVAQQVANPVASFADKNGVVIQMANVPSGGADTASGTLYFGIGTQANNKPPAGVTTIPLDNVGDFTTNFQSTALTHSFVDTGSNGLFFGTVDTKTLKTSTNITACNVAASGQPAAYFYCPSSELSESASVSSTATPADKTTVNFQVGNAKNIKTWVNSDFAGPNTSDIPNAGVSFDWGLPFFFGRSVYIGLEGASSSLGSDLYIAF
jgi:hypothetical protein